MRLRCGRAGGRGCAARADARQVPRRRRAGSFVTVRVLRQGVHGGADDRRGRYARGGRKARDAEAAPFLPVPARGRGHPAQKGKSLVKQVRVGAVNTAPTLINRVILIFFC